MTLMSADFLDHIIEWLFCPTYIIIYGKKGQDIWIKLKILNHH